MKIKNQIKIKNKFNNPFKLQRIKMKNQKYHQIKTKILIKIINKK